MTRTIWPRALRGAIAAVVCAAGAVAWAEPSGPTPGAGPLDTAGRQPIERFAALPLVAHVALSPDGQRVAALMNRVEGTLLIVKPVAGGKAQSVLASDNKDFVFNWVRWVGDERLLVSLRFASRRGFVGTVETRLISIRPDGTGALNLVRNRPAPGSALVHSQQIQDRVIDWMPDDGHHVLLQLGDRDSALPGVYKVNVETGERRLVKAPERHVHDWIADAQHRVRIGVRSVSGRHEVIAADPDGADWRTLWAFDDLQEGVWPLGFGRDPQELYVQAYHEGRMAVFTVRLDEPGLARRLRLAHPQRDVGGELIRSPATGEVLGLRASGVDVGPSGEPRAELWAPEWRSLARGIDNALPERDNRLIDISRDEQRYLVHSSGNGKPGDYYLGLRGRGELALLAETYPALDPQRLAGKRVVTIRARDGLSLDAYLTMPKGRAAGDGGAPLPMVLLPHGGPQSRDGQDFDPWTEFLADRGLAVLQVNFRGSVGYGYEFQAAGLKRWGLEMQDDLADAVAWAAAQRIADPARVCIVGASYGGYAALMGAVKTPELYRCAASFAGVTDLPDLIAFQSDYIGGREAADRMIGKAWGDRERLRATSPALQAERIRVPVLLVHGTDDRSVPVEQGQDMAKALRRAGKDYRYIEQEGGDHHLSQYRHRLEFFQALEAFLDEHLRPRVAPP